MCCSEDLITFEPDQTASLEAAFTLFDYWGLVAKTSAAHLLKDGTEQLHTLWMSIGTLPMPCHVATWPLKRKSTGFDWLGLGTLSSQTGHKLTSSISKMLFSSELHGSFLDHVLTKLCGTASLSVKATTLNPFQAGHQVDTAMSKASPFPE